MASWTRRLNQLDSISTLFLLMTIVPHCWWLRVVVRPVITHPCHRVSQPEEVDHNDRRKLASSIYKTVMYRTFKQQLKCRYLVYAFVEYGQIMLYFCPTHVANTLFCRCFTAELKATRLDGQQYVTREVRLSDVMPCPVLNLVDGKNLTDSLHKKI